VSINTKGFLATPVSINTKEELAKELTGSRGLPASLVKTNTGIHANTHE
jgi:hypothetical protein